MSRPHSTTPIRIVIAILGSLGEWCDKYQVDIARLYGADFDAAAICRELRDRLDERQKAYLREQREDVGHTNLREEVVEETRSMVSSGVSLARIAFDGHKNRADILSDFASGPPSDIRSPNMAAAALAKLETAFEIHRDTMQDVFANLSDFDAKIEALSNKVTRVQSDDVRERQETRQAHDEREETRSESISLIRKLHMAAEAVEIFQPGALRDLNVLFETHNPTRSADNSDPDAPAPADEPTPAGDDPGEDAPTDDVLVDSPTEA